MQTPINYEKRFSGDYRARGSAERIWGDFYIWPGEFLEDCRRISPRILMANFFCKMFIVFSAGFDPLTVFFWAIFGALSPRLYLCIYQGDLCLCLTHSGRESPPEVPETLQSQAFQNANFSANFDGRIFLQNLQPCFKGVRQKSTPKKSPKVVGILLQFHFSNPKVFHVDFLLSELQTHNRICTAPFA